MTSRAEELIREVLALPTLEKVRVVEAVVHDLAGVPGIEPPSAEPAPSLIGLFADEPDAVDEMLATVMDMRRRSRLKTVERDDDESAS
jgi:hypothetical protein